MREAIPQALRVVRIVMKRRRMVVFVELDARAPVMTTPEIARAAIAIMPTLTEHACVNKVGPTFGDVIEHTSLPHLLEHMVVDAQISDDATPVGTTFAATTEWISREAKTARIEIEYADDLTALRSLCRAQDILNSIVVL